MYARVCVRSLRSAVYCRRGRVHADTRARRISITLLYIYRDFTHARIYGNLRPGSIVRLTTYVHS